METRAPFVIVGAFVLAAIAAVFGFIFWLHSTGNSGPRTAYQIQFDGSVPGLLVGAARRGLGLGGMTWGYLPPRRRDAEFFGGTG